MSLERTRIPGFTTECDGRAYSFVFLVLPLNVSLELTRIPGFTTVELTRIAGFTTECVGRPNTHSWF